jgi:hypothetical protein
MAWRVATQQVVGQPRVVTQQVVGQQLAVTWQVDGRRRVVTRRQVEATSTSQLEAGTSV